MMLILLLTTPNFVSSSRLRDKYFYMEVELGPRVPASIRIIEVAAFQGAIYTVSVEKVNRSSSDVLISEVAANEGSGLAGVHCIFKNCMQSNAPVEKV